MHINQITETRTFSPKLTPMQELVIEYAFFISMGIIAMDQDAKDQNSQKILLQLIQRLQKDSKVLQPDDKTKLENNKNKILHYINSMIEYIIPIMKTHLKPEAWDKRKKQTDYTDSMNEQLEDDPTITEKDVQEMILEDISIGEAGF